MSQLSTIPEEEFMLAFEIRPKRSLIAVAFLAAALLFTLFAPVQSADAAKVTACVKKETGEMRLVTGKKAKKKCRAGWNKITWNKRGRRGPSGLLPQVRDVKGRLVGGLLGVFPAPFPAYLVLRDGGQYMYFGSGDLYPLGSPSFTTVDCSGTAYLDGGFGPGSVSKQLKMIGGPFRLVFRTSNAGGFGPAKAWKSAGTHESVVSMQTYSLDSSGVCQPDGSLFTGEMFALKKVKAPPDFVGPLMVK